MDVTLPQALGLVTAAGVFFGALGYFRGVRRDSARDSEQKGKDKTALNGLVKDVDRIMDVEMPRLQQIEILTRENAVQIKNLADLEGKRSTSLDRILEHLDKKGP